MLIAAPVHEAINPIGVQHQRQGAAATDHLAAGVQALEAVETIEALAAAQEAPLVTEVVVLQEGHLQEAGPLAVQVAEEVTKPINQQKII